MLQHDVSAVSCANMIHEIGPQSVSTLTCGRLSELFEMGESLSYFAIVKKQGKIQELAFSKGCHESNRGYVESKKIETHWVKRYSRGYPESLWQNKEKYPCLPCPDLTRQPMTSPTLQLHCIDVFVMLSHLIQLLMKTVGGFLSTGPGAGP